MIEPKEEFMRAAIEEAVKAKNSGDYAIGAVVIKGGVIIARGTNRSKIEKDATQHAEIVAIREASKTLDSRYLEGCILYTTHEPCPMCSAAAVWAKLRGVVFGARIGDMEEYERHKGKDLWKWRVINISAREVFEKVLGKERHHVEISEGFMRDECRKLFHS